MRRLHLLEIEDQPWCPAVLRDAATDYLEFMIRLGNAYAPVAPLLRERMGWQVPFYSSLGNEFAADIARGASRHTPIVEIRL